MSLGPFRQNISGMLDIYIFEILVISEIQICLQKIQISTLLLTFENHGGTRKLTYGHHPKMNEFVFNFHSILDGDRML